MIIEVKNMITITFYGLDQFVVGRLSRELTTGIARIYNVSEDDVNFIAPACLVFHNGVEQTSWNILVQVSAPIKTADKESKIKDLLFKGIGQLAINVTVEFLYYELDKHYVKLNESYPRYITEENIVETETDYSNEELEEGEENDQIYTGDIFSDVLKK